VAEGAQGQVTRLFLSESPDNHEEISEEASSVLQRGGVVLYPSDTVYGLLCRADSLAAVERVRSIKSYTSPRPFILIVDGIRMAESIARGFTKIVQEYLTEHWPGKVTAVLPAADGCPEWVRASDGTVAVRHPADRLGGLILASAGTPMVSTSANVTGDPPPLSPDDIPEELILCVDLFIDAGPLPQSEPSTIVKLTGPTPEILRGRI